ncbi:hypothetical protein LOTGIDRAFT_239394 [Lottia gigantea]|uniref:Reelin domain-containing protein n=1 Tax=Lottia gigantea TaxID=225164 RepID=V4C318_LOTGI|nr:hypothetical protein LOTGIDRAFT_239394 [Lottia gigantea]ESO95889.1 hypothetical protein LOTGIDRAFT_239394 [Lottia gigantea]
MPSILQFQLCSLRSDSTIYILVVILGICHYGNGYPGGAPDSACGAMFPSGHSAPPQGSSPPYRIILAKKTYSPGETVKVIIEAKKGHYFKGILLQARNIGCNVNGSDIVGVFTANDNELETKHCFGKVHSSVTHNSNSPKRTKFIYWTAPVHSAGHVIIRATLVEDTSTFWINVVSDILVDLHSRDTPKCIQSTVFPIFPVKGVAYSGVYSAASTRKYTVYELMTILVTCYVINLSK